MRGNSFCAEVDKISLHIAYYFSALKNSVVYEPPLQEKKMQRRLTTRQALEMILSEVNPCDSDGEDIELQPDSDSELSDLSSDEETAPQPKKRARLGTDLTETAKDGTVWREEQVGTRLPFTPIKAYAADGEPTAKARKSISSRLQSFLCFITLDMLHSIQEWTIQHAQETEHVHWFMALPELMAFIAIVILRGLTKVPSLRDCWSANLGNPHIIGTMPRNRFQDIMRHLRFDDRSTRSDRAKTDKFAAISSVWGSFVTNCITSYNPGLHITVDEQLFPSKTRCCFLQYIATKPDKFGIKFWVACDLKSKYICNVLPYLGKDPSRPSGERLSENVVMRLMEPFLDKGRNVTTDNFFTSLSLAHKLLSRKTTILGTVNKIRREIPQSARHTDRNEFTTQVFSTTAATLTAYAPKRKKTVYILSSMHSVIQTDNTTKRKPNTVTLYNTTKCGVDVMDQMVREYTVRTGTRRWPVAVFYNMIDMAALNAHVLYQACTGRQERRVDFLVELARELANSHMCVSGMDCGFPRPLSDGPLGRHQLVVRFLRGAWRIGPAAQARVPWVLAWDLLKGLSLGPFEPLELASEKHVTLVGHYIP
uniref:PiggyBac transposable element-derived protein domain-containing protein n=2 Tax=Cyprinoidei TaxID=30727 RepID=A0A8C1ZSM4_CYPCA